MSNKKIAMIQSNYLPWKGYFDIINLVDEFVLYDEVQFTKNDWRNRNQIKTPTGKDWITIPVLQKSLDQKISETIVVDNFWRKKHWKTIVQNYKKAKFFQTYAPILENLYLNSEEIYLSKINHQFIKAVNSILCIKTKIVFDKQYDLRGSKTERIIHICKQAGASEYISGPSGKNYIGENLFEEADITLTYFDYSGYPEYSQLFGSFDHAVSIIDLVLNEGPNAPNYMKSF